MALAGVRLVGFLTGSFMATAIAGAMNGMNINSAPFRRWYYRLMNKVLGLRLVVRGVQSTDRPRLVVSNHISYFDIIALGSLVAGDFVAKADIAKWPVFGIMAKAGRSVFIDRRRASTSDARDQIQERLDHGDTLIMFPEATSGDGNTMKPFKSALFTVAERHAKDAQGNLRDVVVQPVSIAYTRLNGLPMGVGWRSYVAWYGDMELAPHLWRAATLGILTIEVIFHRPVTLADFANRKALAAHCDRVVRQGLAGMLAGRAA
jgi:1-acyl-sn-glycerol-3-phosphate acyltransferase